MTHGPARDPASRVAVVLVNWNGATDTLATLASLDRVRGAELWPIVVDNGSRDDSVTRLRGARPDLEVVETGSNLGFAGGNLAGIRHALGTRRSAGSCSSTPTSWSIRGSSSPCSRPA